MSRILLFSSGLDSFIAWRFLNNPPCLHFAGHSRYSDKEFYSVQRIKNKHPEMNLRILWTFEWLREFEEPDANIPLRNAHFVLAAAHFGDHIYMPCQLGEQEIPDRSPRFFEEFSKAVSYLSGKETIIDPVFPEMTKQDIVKWYLEQGHPKEELWDTYSCESESAGRCGACKMCFRTAVCLDYNSILPDGFFENDIWHALIIDEYIQKLRNGEHEQRRADQTIQVLKKRGLI